MHYILFIYTHYVFFFFLNKHIFTPMKLLSYSFSSSIEKYLGQLKKYITSTNQSELLEYFKTVVTITHYPFDYMKNNLLNQILLFVCLYFFIKVKFFFTFLYNFFSKKYEYVCDLYFYKVLNNYIKILYFVLPV